MNKALRIVSIAFAGLVLLAISLLLIFVFIGLMGVGTCKQATIVRESKLINEHWYGDFYDLKLSNGDVVRSSYVAKGGRFCTEKKTVFWWWERQTLEDAPLVGEVNHEN